MQTCEAAKRDTSLAVNSVPRHTLFRILPPYSVRKILTHTMISQPWLISLATLV